MRVVIRADASLEIGSGHIMRCLTLANELRVNGAEVLFICKELEGNLIKLIGNQGFPVEVLPVSSTSDGNLFHSSWLGSTQVEDATMCLKVLCGKLYDWMIVDHYAIDERWESEIKPWVKNILAIDDLGDRTHICDALLDQNYGSTQSKYESLVSEGTRLMLGSSYALLRREFLVQRERSLVLRASYTVERILIFLGGVDFKNDTSWVLDKVSELNIPTLRFVDVVLGPTSRNVLGVQKKLSSLDISSRLSVGVTNMAELMAEADLCIGAPGSSSWERCCLGLPTVQLILAENQRQIGYQLNDAEAAILVNSAGEFEQAFMTAIDKLQLISQNAAKLVDGKGAARVREMLYTLKQVDESDCRLVPFEFLTKAETSLVLAMRNYPEVRKWMTNTGIITGAQHIAFLEKLSVDNSRKYLLVYKGSLVIGSINFTEINSETGSAEFGIYANPFLDEPGRGGFLIKQAEYYSKKILGLTKIILTVHVQNHRAIKLYEKYGYLKQIANEDELNLNLNFMNMVKFIY